MRRVRYITPSSYYPPRGYRGMSAARSKRQNTERRKRARSRRENAATGIVQLIIRNPRDAARALDEDLRDGADVDVILGLLDAAEQIVQLRGLDLSTTIAGLRQRVERQRS